MSQWIDIKKQLPPEGLLVQVSSDERGTCTGRAEIKYLKTVLGERVPLWHSISNPDHFYECGCNNFWRRIPGEVQKLGEGFC